MTARFPAGLVDALSGRKLQSGPSEADLARDGHDAWAVTSGALLVTVESAHATANAQSVTAQISYRVPVTTAAATANAQSVSVQPGPVHADAQSAQAVASAVPLGVLPGNVNVAVQTAQAYANAQPASVYSIVRVGVQTATAKANAHAVTVAPLAPLPRAARPYRLSIWGMIFSGIRKMDGE